MHLCPVCFLKREIQSNEVQGCMRRTVDVAEEEARQGGRAHFRDYVLLSHILTLRLTMRMFTIPV